MNIEDLIKNKRISNFDVCFYDSWCGEPVSWGHKLLDKFTEQEWSELSKLGEKDCAYGNGGNWYLITKKLTHQEAITKYGKVTNEEFGVRGGFKSRTYGSKKFSKDLRK